ncbi:MAG: hypothetical protein ACRDG7_12165 [Candidatus Limnocylindria bacterium]
MTSPLTAALASLVHDALPWLRWLEAQHGPPHDPDEAFRADLAEGLIDATPRP